MDDSKYGFADVRAAVFEPEFRTYHWRLEVPKTLYEEVLEQYSGNIYTEEPAQEFVTHYLAWRKDKGIVGLVGLAQEGDRVILDAAVRYPCRGGDGEGQIKN